MAEVERARRKRDLDHAAADLLSRDRQRGEGLVRHAALLAESTRRLRRGDAGPSKESQRHPGTALRSWNAPAPSRVSDPHRLLDLAKSVARYAAVAEGITGQFYLAILVARLVGLYITRSVSSDSREQRAP